MDEHKHWTLCKVEEMGQENNEQMKKTAAFMVTLKSFSFNANTNNTNYDHD